MCEQIFSPGSNANYESVSAEQPDSREGQPLAKLVDVTPPPHQKSVPHSNSHADVPLNTTSLLYGAKHAFLPPPPYCHIVDLQVLGGPKGRERLLPCAFSATGTQPVAQRYQAPRHGLLHYTHNLVFNAAEGAQLTPSLLWTLRKYSSMSACVATASLQISPQTKFRQ